ncbi:TrmH family RNA methyltransferase [Jiangella gansuensis]|uniref:TrmH family RNA methyltransferase n=1 Tax=Jiangella gansuensis TaxID=281473 RepID=UPI00047C9BEB|nr:RNA methyltransferase [Jiangella gansuensis]
MLTERSGRVREARKLLRRPAREKSGRFLAEGPQAVREAVAAGPGRVLEVFATPAAAQRWPEIIATAQAAGVSVVTAADAALAALSETVTPQGLVAVCRSVTVDLATALGGGPRLVAVLAEARDPGNAGTVIRCADAAGADALVLTRGSADPEGGKAVRASAGSVFHLPVSSGAPASDTVDALRAAGLTVLAADGIADLDLDQAEDAGLLSGPVAWMFGNEAWGLPPGVRSLADHVVRVPIHGRAESLNLATAAAVCLYATARAQRRPAQP